MEAEESEELTTLHAQDLKVGMVFLHNNQSRWKVTEIPGPDLQRDSNCIRVLTEGKKFGTPKSFNFGLYVQLEIEKQ